MSIELGVGRSMLNSQKNIYFSLQHASQIARLVSIGPSFAIYGDIIRVKNVTRKDGPNPSSGCFSGRSP